MLVRGKSRPSPLADREQFGDQQSPDPSMLFLPQDMLDLPMGLGLVRPVLHEIQIVGPHGKRFQCGLEAGTGHEHLAIAGRADHPGLVAGRNIHALRLPIPDIPAAIADGGEYPTPGFDIDGPRCRHDAGLEAWYRIAEFLVRFQLDDIEIVQRHDVVSDIDNRPVPVVMWRNVHGSRWSCA